MTNHPDITDPTISQLAELVHGIAERAPLLEARTEKAATILLRGKVSPIAIDAYQVTGTDGESYTVDYRAQTCTCPDFQHRAPEYSGARWCKHRLAVVLLRKLGRPTRRVALRRDRLSPFRRPARRLIVRKAA